MAMTSAAVGAVVAALACGLHGWFSGYEEARPEAPMLNDKEQAVALAAADAMFPRGGVLPISGSEAGVLTYLDATFRASPPRTRLLMRLLLRFVEHAPWVLGPASRLTRQTQAERVATLNSWANSSNYLLRIVFTSLRTLVSMAYLANVDVLEHIGASPDCAPFGGVPAAGRGPGIDAGEGLDFGPLMGRTAGAS